MTKNYYLTYEQQINSVLEEVFVISFEIDYNIVKGLKHVTTIGDYHVSNK